MLVIAPGRIPIPVLALLHTGGHTKRVFLPKDGRWLLIKHVGLHGINRLR